MGEARAGEQQAVEGAACPEQVPTAERGDDALAHLGAGAFIRDKLAVAALAVGFGAEEHGARLRHYKCC